jgi:hypothetical protein
VGVGILGHQHDTNSRVRYVDGHMRNSVTSRCDGVKEGCYLFVSILIFSIMENDKWK